jgi:hypothetical protein
MDKKSSSGNSIHVFYERLNCLELPRLPTPSVTRRGNPPSLPA